MNVEKTMTFLLDNQARSAERMDRMERLQARTDRRVDGITKLVRIGMKMLIEDRKSIAEARRLHKEMDYKLNALIESQMSLMEAQKRTEQQLAETDQQLKRTDEQIKRTDEKLARSDEKFERLLAALLRKRTNGRR